MQVLEESAGAEVNVICPSGDDVRAAPLVGPASKAAPRRIAQTNNQTLEPYPLSARYRRFSNSMVYDLKAEIAEPTACAI